MAHHAKILDAEAAKFNGDERFGAPELRTGPVVMVTGAIAPYTHRLYEALGRRMDGPLHVLTCVDVEPQRKWTMPSAKSYQLEVMPGLRLHRSDTRHIYLNPTVLRRLVQIRPRAIVVNDFSPTMLIATAYARLTGTPYAIHTDGSRAADPGQKSIVHAWFRRLIVPGARVGIGASEDSLALLANWGLDKTSSVLAPIATAWDAPERIASFDERPFDVLYCGALEDSRKGVGFLLDALVAAKERGHSLSCRFVGHGPLRSHLEARLATHGIAATFDGYLQPSEIVRCYSSAKVLAFPTRSDCWGLVANEAILSGTPVISSPHAVSSIELVERYRAGMVRPLDVDAWADALIVSTRIRRRWDAMHAACAPASRSFTLERACGKMANALRKLIA